MSVPAPEDIAFRYTAVDRSGKQVRDVVHARDARAAARALAADGLTPLNLTETKIVAAGGRNRDLTSAERVAVLRQLALMVEAGVGLLEAMQTVAAGVVAARGRAKLEAAITALKRGESLGVAFETHVTGFPFYVYSMLKVGEATGKIAEVLVKASEQMAYEHKLRGEFFGSLAYPAFLVVIGVAAVFVILLRVIPTFSELVGEDRQAIPAISRFVFSASDFVNANLFLIGLGGFALVALLGIGLGHPALRPQLYAAARGTPGLSGIIRAREIGSWARIMAFSLSSGVALLDAAALAREAAPKGEFADNLVHFERDLKSGVDVADSLSRHTRLTAMDLSLLRAGQKSGTLAKMFGFIAEGYDTALRNGLKRLTTFVPPLTILAIALMVGLLAAAVLLSMTSVYETL
jgi:general secretion pathway protein F